MFFTEKLACQRHTAETALSVPDIEHVHGLFIRLPRCNKQRGAWKRAEFPAHDTFQRISSLLNGCTPPIPKGSCMTPTYTPRSKVSPQSGTLHNEHVSAVIQSKFIVAVLKIGSLRGTIPSF